MQYTLQNLKTIWTNVLEEKDFARRFYINFAFCFVTYIAFAQLVAMNKDRPGVVLNDVVQNMLPPHNFSPFIFLLTYSGIVLFLRHFIYYPKVLYYAFQGFTAIFIVRTILIFLIPLAAPLGQIVLVDPFLDCFVPGSSSELTNDLFFSGHISDLSFFIFCSPEKWLKYWLIGTACVVGVLLIWQRVHYSADVFAAPFFAYWGYVVFVKHRG
jgi:hypothetical protein